MASLEKDIASNDAQLEELSIAVADHLLSWDSTPFLPPITALPATAVATSTSAQSPEINDGQCAQIPNNENIKGTNCDDMAQTFDTGKYFFVCYCICLLMPIRCGRVSCRTLPSTYCLSSINPFCSKEQHGDSMVCIQSGISKYMQPGRP